MGWAVWVRSSTYCLSPKKRALTRSANSTSSPLSHHKTQISRSSSSSSSNSDGAEITAEEDDSKDHCKGGYHPVSIGETFKDGRYIIIRKLG